MALPFTKAGVIVVVVDYILCPKGMQQNNCNVMVKNLNHICHVTVSFAISSLGHIYFKSCCSDLTNSLKSQ